MTIHVGIIDDSVMVRSTLKKMITSESGFSVAGTCEDVYQGRSMIMEEDPDVLTLDVEMPRMDGLTFLKKLMEHNPMPVVMVSSLTKKTSRKGMKALEEGAIELVAKPDGDKANSIQALHDELIPKLKAAYRARTKISNTSHQSRSGKRSSKQIELPKSQYDAILIGSSTGGVDALKAIFRDLTDGLPPILIVQHMPPVFTTKFAERLNNLSPVSVREANNGKTLGPGEARLAPGDKHMTVRRFDTRNKIKLALNEEPKVHSHRPSADVLFQSASNRMKSKNILAIVLTGMGKDGRDGAIQLAKHEATIVAQDQATSTIYGMPKQVKTSVSSAFESPLGEIASIMNQSKKNNKKRST